MPSIVQLYPACPQSSPACGLHVQLTFGAGGFSARRVAMMISVLRVTLGDAGDACLPGDIDSKRWSGLPVPVSTAEHCSAVRQDSAASSNPAL